MDCNIYLSILSAVSAFLSALATVGMSIISRNQTRFLKETEKANNTPYLYPVKHEFRKDEWIRFYSSIPTIDDVIPKKHYNELTDTEKEFCNHSQKFNMQTYFDYLDNELILVTKGENKTHSYVVEHHNIQIELINYGSLITKIHIDYIEQHFENGECLLYKGGDESYYTSVIIPNQKIKIVLDEIKSGTDIGSCQLGKEEYNELKNYNMFEDIAPKIVNYNEYIIGLSIWNQHGDKFLFEIKIYRKGEKFYRDVIEKQ